MYFIYNCDNNLSSSLSYYDFTYDTYLYCLLNNVDPDKCFHTVYLLCREMALNLIKEYEELPLPTKYQLVFHMLSSVSPQGP